MEPGLVKPEVNDYTAEAYDNYLNVQVIVPLIVELSKGKVLKRKLDRDDKPRGIRNKKSILDTRQYEVKFPSGKIHAYTADTLAENL